MVRQRIHSIVTMPSMRYKQFDPAKDRVRTRIYPADVITKAKSIGGALALVTEDSVFCYVNSSTAPALVFSDRLDHIEHTPQGMVLTLSDGDKIIVRRGSGCGCGSRLKHWMPTAPVPNYGGG